MSLPGSRFTYDDYKLLPDDKRYEVIEGELLVTPAPSFHHQVISSRLIRRMGAFVEAHGLGEVVTAPTDVILSSENVVQPDLLFIARERLAMVDPAGGVRGAPDLVVEIVSPSSAGRDRVQKRQLYGRYGVREYWVVDHAARAVELLTPGAGGMETWQVFSQGAVLTSPLLPGFSLRVAEIFPD